MLLAFWEDEIGEPAAPKERRRRARFAEREFLCKPERLMEADDIVLWIGPELDDQLMLAWMPQLLRALGKPIGCLRIVQIERNADCPEIPTLSSLQPADFARHSPPRLLNEAEVGYLEDAWSAVTAPDPSALLNFLARKSAAMPLIAPALRQLFRRYPDAASGLNRSEAALLDAVRDFGPAAASVIAYSLKALWDEGEYVGDRWLYWRLQRLANRNLPHPAVTMAGLQTVMRGTEVCLTEIGERIAAGEANFVELNGIDDWVGGVHLDSRDARVWFQKDGSLR